MTSTRYTSRALIAVAAAQRQAANDACEAVATGGRGTFRVQWPPQDETGTVVAEYYLCDWQMLPETRPALEAEFIARGIPAIFTDCDHWDPQRRTINYDTVDADLKVRTGRTVSFAALRMAPLPLLKAIPRHTKLALKGWWHRLWAALWRWVRTLAHVFKKR